MVRQPQHKREDSYPVSPLQYEESPTFVYSAGRPETTYSHYSWTPPSATAGPSGRNARRSSLPPPLPVLPVQASNGLGLSKGESTGKTSPESDYSPPAQRDAPKQILARAPAQGLAPHSSSSSEYSPPGRPRPNYVSGTGGLPAQTPLYARASWDDPYNGSNFESDDFKSPLAPARPWLQNQGTVVTAGRRMTASSRGRSAYVADPTRPDSWADEPTAWSRSSFNTTAVPSVPALPQVNATGQAALGTMMEEGNHEYDLEEKGYYDDISLAPQTAPQTAPSMYTPQPRTTGQSAERIPSVPPLGDWYAPKSALGPEMRHSRRSSAPLRPTMYDSPSAYTRHSIDGAGAPYARNTVGSVFDMNALSAVPYPLEYTPGVTNTNTTRSGPPIPALPAAALPPMLSPSKQHQLGRMSVAPARYTLQASARVPAIAPGHSPRMPAQMNGFPPHTGLQQGGFPPHTAAQHAYVADPFADPPQDPAFDVDEKAAARFYRQQQQSRGLQGGTNPYRDPALGWEPAQDIEGLQEQEKSGAFAAMMDKMRNSTFGVYYRTYRIFARPILTICAAMCLSLTIQGPSGGTGWGTIVKLGKGGMGWMPPETDGKEVGLGLLGWCVLGPEDPVCLPYRTGDFISTSKKYRIPAEGSSLLINLTNLLTALMVLLYILAAFHLVTAFLHFFLFFGISVPFDHLFTTEPLPPLTGFTAASRPVARKGGVTNRQVLQKEVDMRVRCERDPYEAYYWVWWAWWAHRRSGLGDLFAMLAGLMGIGTLIMASQFYMQVRDAANLGKISIGAGTLVALLAFFLTLDPFISSIRYACRVQSSFLTFLHPPEPSVGAIVLPPKAERMRHRKNPSGTPFRLGNGNAAARAPEPTFGQMGQLDQYDRQVNNQYSARPGTVNFPLPPPSRASRAASQYRRDTIRTAGRKSMFFDPHAPPMPSHSRDAEESMPRTAVDMGELDDETIRWLAAYPHDPDLFPLIERVKESQRRLAAGEEMPEDDFILSDVGLLYLRPDAGSNGTEQDALLVPPRGEIRQEILSDTHSAIIDEDSDEAAHWEAEEMVRQMGETFWWPSMGSDAQAFVGGCDGCPGG